MEERYYKVVVCHNNGEKPFYIKVTEGGEFYSEEFNHDAYSFFNNSKIDPKLTIMLNNGVCVKEIQEFTTVTDNIKEAITDDNTFDISEIQTFESCSECNKKGYALELKNGTIIYPTNSDELKPYEEKYIKFEYDGVVNIGKVITYKYHTKNKEGVATFIDGCYESYEEVENIEEKKIYNTGRIVSPEVLTKKRTIC